MPGLGGVRWEESGVLRTGIAVALPTLKWPAASRLTGRDTACATFDPPTPEHGGEAGGLGWWRWWSAGWGGGESSRC